MADICMAHNPAVQFEELDQFTMNKYQDLENIIVGELPIDMLGPELSLQAVARRDGFEKVSERMLDTYSMRVQDWEKQMPTLAKKVASERINSMYIEDLWVVWERVVAHQQFYQRVGTEWQGFIMDVGSKGS